MLSETHRITVQRHFPDSPLTQHTHTRTHARALQNPGVAVIGFVEDGNDCDPANILGLASYKWPSPSQMSGGLPGMPGPNTVHRLCLSKDGGNHYVLQDFIALEVVYGDEFSITANAPGLTSTITTFDNPQTITLIGVDLLVSATTVVGFALSSWYGNGFGCYVGSVCCCCR